MLLQPNKDEMNKDKDYNHKKETAEDALHYVMFGDSPPLQFFGFFSKMVIANYDEILPKFLFHISEDLHFGLVRNFVLKGVEKKCPLLKYTL